MKKNVIIAIGIVISIVVVVFGFTVNTGKKTEITLNSTNTTTSILPTQVSPTPPTQGRHFSVNLTENVGVAVH